MSLLCTRNQVLKGFWRQEMVLKKILKLFSIKIWRIKKVALPLQPLSVQNESLRFGSSKKKFKIFSKRFGSLEKLPYLCNRFPLQKSERETERLIDFGLEIQIRSLRYLSS